MLSFRENLLTYTLIPLLVFLVVVSYVRSVVLNDYIVSYESDCDPYTESCYIGCEDDACTEEYYYSIIQKYAPHVEAQCGVDITECEAAYECLLEDGDFCEVTYCDPEIEGDEVCEVLTEADYEEESLEDTEEGITENSITSSEEDVIESTDMLEMDVAENTEATENQPETEEVDSILNEEI